MLAQHPKQLAAHNEILQWEEYNEQVVARQLLQVSEDSTLIITCQFLEIGKLHCILRVWDGSTLQLIGRTDNIYDYIVVIQISPNNKWIMYQTFFTCKVIEICKLNNPPILEYNIKQAYRSQYFTFDSKYIIKQENPLIMHSITDQTQTPIPIDYASKNINYIEYGRDMLITAANYNTIKVWSFFSFKNIHNWFSKGWIKQIKLSSNQKILFTNDGKVSIKMWSLQTKKLIRNQRQKEYEVQLPGLQLEFSPTNSILLYTLKSQNCLLWNMISGKCITLENNPDSSAVYKFTQDGQFIIRYSYSQRMKVWNIDCDQYFEIIQ